MKNRIDALYDLRNNIHILKAVNNQNLPKFREAKEAFRLMCEFVEEVKRFTANNTAVEKEED